MGRSPVHVILLDSYFQMLFPNWDRRQGIIHVAEEGKTFIVLSE
jgi:hypothetical protein